MDDKAGSLVLAIDSGALVTIVTTIISIVLTFGITWYFARRHYLRPRPEKITSTDIELERVRLAARNEVLEGLFTIAVVLGVLILPILVLVMLWTD